MFRVTWPERVCLGIPHRNALTEIAWEDAVHGLVNCRYKAASNRSALLRASPATESDERPLYWQVSGLSEKKLHFDLGDKSEKLRFT